MTAKKIRSLLSGSSGARGRSSHETRKQAGEQCSPRLCRCQGHEGKLGLLQGGRSTGGAGPSGQRGLHLQSPRGERDLGRSKETAKAGTVARVGVREVGLQMGLIRSLGVECGSSLPEARHVLSFGDLLPLPSHICPPGWQGPVRLGPHSALWPGWPLLCRCSRGICQSTKEGQTQVWAVTTGRVSGELPAENRRDSPTRKPALE